MLALPIFQKVWYNNKIMDNNENKNLLELRHALLALHKILLDHQKHKYESTHQKVASTGQYFELVTNHRDFAWLKTLSELIVSLDIFLEGKDEKNQQPEDLITYIKKLLSSTEPRNEFAEKYRAAIKGDPAVALAHAGVMQKLK